MALGNNENVSDDAIRELEEVLRENRRNALVAELRDDEKKALTGAFPIPNAKTFVAPFRSGGGVCATRTRARSRRRCAPAEWRIPSSAWT